MLWDRSSLQSPISPEVREPVRRGRQLLEHIASHLSCLQGNVERKQLPVCLFNDVVVTVFYVVGLCRVGSVANRQLRRFYLRLYGSLQGVGNRVERVQRRAVLV